MKPLPASGLLLLLLPALAAAQGAASSYVTILAKAVLVTEAAEKVRHWKPSWTPFYPGGATGDVVLIRLSPSRMEVVSAARGVVPDAKTWLPLATTFPQ